MFASGMEESHKHEIKMEEIDASTFETVLAFIYTGRVDITDSNVQELFVQAQLLQIQQLVELCVMFFQVTHDGCCIRHNFYHSSSPLSCECCHLPL